MIKVFCEATPLAEVQVQQVDCIQCPKCKGFAVARQHGRPFICQNCSRGWEVIPSNITTVPEARDWLIRYRVKRPPEETLPRTPGTGIQNFIEFIMLPSELQAYHKEDHDKDQIVMIAKALENLGPRYVVRIKRDRKEVDVNWHHDGHNWSFTFTNP